MQMLKMEGERAGGGSWEACSAFFRLICNQCQKTNGFRFPGGEWGWWVGR